MAAGVIGKPKRLFVTAKDVEKMFGCGGTYAYNAVRNVNAEAKKRGQLAPPAGKASKYLFSELYGIPIADVEAVLTERKEE